jgi:hypothetical protein
VAYTAHDLQDLVRGDDWPVQLVLTDNAGAAIDITGNTYWFTIKASPDDVSPLAQASIVATGADALLGKVTVAIPSSSTSTIVPGKLYYDIQEKDSTNKIYTLLLGRVKVIKDITLAT